MDGVKPSLSLDETDMPYVLCLLLFISGVAFAAGPRLECAATTHDFGTVASTAVVTQVFVLANSGDAPLKIEWTRACCGVTAELATNVVAAGTNTTLRLVLTLNGQLGRVEKAIYVMSNDPAQPVCRLVLACGIKAARP